MGRIDRCREKVDVVYALAGISADVSQLARGYVRGDHRQVRANAKQIIKRLDRISALL